jgi:fatty acid CoA ligase FadD22
VESSNWIDRDDAVLPFVTDTKGDVNIDFPSARGAEPISELSSIEPQSGAEAQPDDRLASNMRRVAGIAGEGTLNERLAALQQERHRLVLEAVRAEAAKLLGGPDPRSINPDLAFSELGLDSKMTVELCNRLGVVSGLRVPETVGWDYGSISGLAQYLEAELSGDTRAVSTPAGNANELSLLEDELKKVEELVAAIPESEKRRVAERLRALLSTITDSGDRLGKRIEAASSPDEIFALLDSQLGSDER